MRATSMVVALAPLLLAASVDAGPGPAPSSTATKDKTTPSAKAPAGKSGAPASPAPAGPTTADAGAATGAPGPGGASGAPPAPQTDLSTVKPEDMPTAVRMRRLEQKTQALKERAWQLKARVQMLKEQMIGGGVGAQAVIDHDNDMGASFRLVKLVYALDGTQVFARTDDTAESLYKTRSFDVFAGPISPGNHNVSAVATYRGHGYGVFEYLSKYTFTAKGNQAFIAGEGKISRVDCRGFEKGGPTMPLEKRATVECKVVQVQPETHAADKPGAPEARPGAASPASPASSSGAAPGASSPAASSPASPPTSSPAGAAPGAGSPQPGGSPASQAPAARPTAPPASPPAATRPTSPGQPGK
jgi:hypothetical protein